MKHFRRYMQRFARAAAVFAAAACLAFGAACSPSEPPVNPPDDITEDPVTLNPPDDITEDPVTEEKTVWDYSLDDLVNWLVQRGHFVNDDYLKLMPLATESRIYSDVEVYYWDVENLTEGSSEYRYWKEYEENEYLYIMLGGTVYPLLNNGPFAINALSYYQGDVEKLREDFLAFPNGYEYRQTNTPVTENFCHDKSAVYTSYEALVRSYPDMTYSYESDPVRLPVSYSLRDDYIIYTQMQDSVDICWAFAGSTALSTTLTAAKGEYLDFSESWLSLALAYGVKNDGFPNYTNNIESDYIYGKSSGILGFDLVANRYGLVLERDFGFADGYLACQENLEEYYYCYSRFASHDIMYEVSLVRFSNYAIRNKKEVIINSMKSHILSDGALIGWTYTDDWRTAEINGETVWYKNPASTSANEGHIISIIGWDDEISIDGHTGAWIVLNSWGQSEQRQGIMYIFYDDAAYGNANADFFGYKYTGNTSAELYFSDAVVSSNACFPASLKGADYGAFAAATGETRQKNIFYRQDDISLTYSYELSDGARIDDIRILYGSADATALFNVSEDGQSRAFTVSGKGLKHGEYKIEIAYTDGAQTKTYFNSFYLCDGTELNYVSVWTYESANAVKNNGLYEFFYTYGNGDEYVCYATSRQRGRLVLRIDTATYSDIVSCSASSADFVSSGSTFYADIAYDTSVSTEYPVTLTTSDGTEKTIVVRILAAEEGDFAVNVTYFLDGGANAEENGRKLVASAQKPAHVAAPEREGYVFAGWYYDAEFTQALAASDGGYLLGFDRVAVINSPTTGSFSQTGTFANYYGGSVHVFLYAKWIKAD